MTDKQLFWVGTAREDLSAFPRDARRAAGFQLRRVQQGFEPNDWKPMPSVGSGVQEIRIHTGLEHRVFYVAKFEDGVYVLHAFEKRSMKTPKRDLNLARDRLRSLLERRSQDAETRKERQGPPS
jgi:phage-related protein